MNGDKPTRTRIEVGGEWNLEDLYTFARVYEDLYAFIFHFRAALDKSESSEVSELFEREPKSGFGALNLFASLRYYVPKDFKPSVLALEYGSPGFFDLQQIGEIATIVGVVVNLYLLSRGGQPAPPSAGPNISVTNSSNVNIIVNAISRHETEQPQVAEVISSHPKRGAIFRAVRNRVQRLSDLVSQGKITSLPKQIQDDDETDHH